MSEWQSHTKVTKPPDPIQRWKRMWERRFVATQTITWRFRHLRSNLCMTLRLIWSFLKRMKTIWSNPTAKQCLTRTTASFYPSLLTTRISFWRCSDTIFVFTGIIETAEMSTICDVHRDAFSGVIYPAFGHYWFNTYITAFTSEM